MTSETGTLPLTSADSAGAAAWAPKDRPALARVRLLALASAEFLGQDTNPQGNSMGPTGLTASRPSKNQAQGHGFPQTPHFGYHGYCCPSEVPSQKP